MSIILCSTVCLHAHYQLTISRTQKFRDLLQKHYSTYHEVQVNHTGTNPDTLFNQRTPIACSSCATAKAGCDKKVPCSRCSEKNIICTPRFARRSSKGIARSFTAPDYSTAREPPAQLPYQNSQPNGRSDISNDLQMDGGISMEESHSDSDLLFWGNSNGKYSNVSPSFHVSPTSFDILGNAFDGSSELLGNSVDCDPKTVEMYSMNTWNNYTMDVDLSGSKSLHYSAHDEMFWFPDTSDLAPLYGIPSPPCTNSASRSRISSNSPIWQSRNNACSEEAEIQIAGLDRSSSEVPELNLLISTEEAWPLARCNPGIFSGSCPRTAVAHLQTLQSYSRLENAWESMDEIISPDDQSSGRNSLSITTLQSTTRDKIIAFAQSFLLKALMIHQGGLSGQTSTCDAGAAVFFTLPPSNVMEKLLGSSVQSLTLYYPLIHGTTLDPNDLVLDSDASTLLFLLMMAHGASMVPKAEARYLAAGLTETCRISLFDVIEKNVKLSADPVVLKAAFLLILLAAWGGDCWRKYSLLNHL